jgi:hypothetical protein
VLEQEGNGFWMTVICGQHDQSVSALQSRPLKAGLPANLTNSVSTCERDFSRRLNLRTPLRNNSLWRDTRDVLWVGTVLEQEGNGFWMTVICGQHDQEEPLKAGLPANLTNSVSTCERDFSRRLNLRTPLSA